MKAIRKYGTLNRQFYDFTECSSPESLASAIRYFNENGISVISITQNGDDYKVFFRRDGPVRTLYVSCDGIAELEATIRYINHNRLELISVTQKGEHYKVFFRRSAP